MQMGFTIPPALFSLFFFSSAAHLPLLLDSPPTLHFSVLVQTFTLSCHSLLLSSLPSYIHPLHIPCSNKNGATSQSTLFDPFRPITELPHVSCATVFKPLTLSSTSCLDAHVSPFVSPSAWTWMHDLTKHTVLWDGSTKGSHTDRNTVDMRHINTNCSFLCYGWPVTPGENVSQEGNETM